MKVALISCVSKKQQQICSARDLYMSPLFKKSLCYAEKNFDKVFVLSALHGLVELEQQIRPYEKTLNNMPISERKLWAIRVSKQLERKTIPSDEVVFLCGKRYREFLKILIPNKTKAPLAHMGIGKQLAFYTKELNQ